MEFSFNINELIPDTITVVDEKLAPFRFRVKNDRYEFAAKQSQLKTVIDKMGEASTRAQGLRATITSALKLQHSDHRLYILKDASANNGLGAVVGILKVGHKKLFLMDTQSIQNEVQPLCVLDFYIHESHQRTGCGKKMFEHMLQMEHKMACQVAIDRPSPKFVAFLRKYYGLKNAIPQANNFVIHEHFFADPQAIGFVPRRSQRLADSGQSGRPPVHPYKRNSQKDNESALLHRRPSGSGRLSHRPTSGGGLSRLSNQLGTMDNKDNSLTMNESLRDVTLPPIGPRPPSRSSAPGSRESSARRRSVASRVRLGSPDEIPSESYNASRGMAARATCYSRHNTRSGSADMVRHSKITVDTNPNSQSDLVVRSNSGGRIRTLHVTSAANPFTDQEQPIQASSVITADARLSSKPVQPETPQQDLNANITTRNFNANRTTRTQRDAITSALSSTGNYSVSALFNTRFGVRPPFLGSSWNIFGVPTYMNRDSSSSHYAYTRRSQQRHHPF